MAKFEIQFTGNNAGLKKVIKDTDVLLKELQSTASSVKISIGGRSVNTNLDGINSRLTQTKTLLTDISRLSSGINTNLGGSSTRGIASDEIQRQRLALAQSNAEAGKYRAEIAKLNSQLAQFRLTQAQSKKNTDAAAGSYREAQQRLTSMGKAIRETAGGFDLNNPKVRAQVEEYRKLNNQLKDFDRAMGNNQRNVGNYRSVLTGLGQNIIQLAASYLSFQAAIGAVGAAFRSSLRSDALQTSLGFILNSSEEASVRLLRVRNTAERLGLSYLSLADSYKSFIGAANASNFSLAQAEKIFNAVSNAGGKLKLSSDQMRGALLALQQMISKGTVQSEELRGQLGERLPGAFAIAARAMGVTEKALGEMMKRGEVMAADLLPKLADELNKTFGNDTTENIESLQASVNRLSNIFDESIQDGRISKFFQAIIDGVSLSIQAVNKLVNSDSWQELFLRSTTLLNPSLKPIIDPELARQDRTRGGQAGFISQRVEELSNATLKEQINILKTEQQVYGDLLRDYEAGDKSLRDSLSKQTDLVSALEKQFAELNPVIAKTNELTDAQLTSISQIRKRISELNKLEGSAIVGSEIFDRIQALKTRLKELSGSRTNVTIQAEPGSFKALQKELSDLQNKAGSTIVGSDTFKQIQALEKRIKVLGDIMKNPVTLSEYLKKNFEAAVKALDKMNFDGLKIEGVTDITKAIDALVGKKWTNSQGQQVQLGTGGSIDDVARQAHAWNQAISDDLAGTSNKVGEDYYQAFSRGVDRFSTDFYETLTNLNKQTDATFGGIFSTLTQGLFSSIQQVFLGGLTTQLTGLFKDGFKKIDFLGLDNKKLSNKISQALVAGAGLAGGLISGITSPTSSVGQGLGGALSGAAAGAIAGPIGAAVGGAIGLIGGLFGASKARKQQEEIQRQQLAELKKQTELARQSALTFTSAIIGQAANGGIVTGVDRDAFGNLVATIAGRDIKLSMERETAAQLRGL